MSGIATPQLKEIAGTAWDAVVIGAGPAGAMAAHQLAHRGLRTLLVDGKRFPRPKVCGGCLNRRGIEALEAARLAHVLDRCAAAPLRTFRWIVGGQTARFTLPDMCVVSRSSFDEALVDEAIRAGAAFLDGTLASVEPNPAADCRWIAAARDAERATLAARVVICADGLSRSSVKRLPEFRSLVRPRSRIGVGATLPSAAPLREDEITMIVSRQGYVGLARSGNGQVNVAAALDPDSLTRADVGAVVGGMLRDAGVSGPDDCRAATWHGTPPLTSRPNRVAAERLFLIGDASGYVEPFSGEGMATALESAVAVAPLAAEAARDGRPSLAAEWEAAQRRLVYEQQATCRQLAWILRRPWAAAAAIGICRAQPWVARRLIAKVN